MQKAARQVAVMSLSTSALCALAMAFPGSASAAPDLKTPTHTGATPGQTTNNAEPGAASNQESRNAFDGETSVDVRVGEREGKRIWSVSGGMETHVAFVQTEPDDARARSDKLYNFFFLTPQVFVTPKDQFRADFGAYEHFTADEGESGFRVADISASYIRYIPFFTEDGLTPSTVPSKGLLARVAVSATAPTSYASQLHGVITVPRLRVYLERAFLDHSLYLTLNGFGEYYVDKYRTSQGGGSNALSRYSVQVTADYFVPFHKRLSLGAAAGSSWTYFYGVEGVNSTPYGTVGDSQFTSQPVSQGYSAELNAVYAFPAVKDIRTSASLTYSVGDNTLHDGVQHLYFAYFRRSTEMYATLTARY
jgi:hypothetical protein